MELEETDEESNKPGGLVLAVLVLVGVLVPVLIAAFLVFDLQPPPPSSGVSTTGTQNGALVSIPIGVGSNQSLNFSPANIYVLMGVNSTVRWVQNDPIPHTVTSTSVPSGASAFDSGNMNKGDSFSVTLTVPGRYEYQCKYHPGWMKGSITLLAPKTRSAFVVLPSGVGSNPNLNFVPANIVVIVGVNNTIQWTDQDSVPHTVTSTSVPSGASAFDSGTMGAGSTFSVTLTIPGTYRYECSFHTGWMVGSILVKAGP